MLTAARSSLFLGPLRGQSQETLVGIHTNTHIYIHTYSPQLVQ